ncbi:hypothetical protein TNCV_243801 [Trichonephila clavipes]|nr:hypothetical protein TNCV_243801 [Trichonephila clavipes]
MVAYRHVYLSVIFAKKTRWCIKYNQTLNRRFPLGIRTVKTVLKPMSRVYDAGHGKVVFSILLSGMMAIGRTMESGRSGYGASSGWKVFGLAESLEAAL